MDFISELKNKYNLNLNNQQQLAVNQINGPCLLLSVPGGGKTTVIVSRCANMVMNHQISANNILTLTFSRMAANDMKYRFESIFGLDCRDKMNFSTIHSFCYLVIKSFLAKTNHSFPTIIEGPTAPINKVKILRDIYLKVNKEYISDDILEELINSIGYIKNMLINPQEIKNIDLDIKNFTTIYCSYDQYKRSNNLLDFDDMLTVTYNLFKKHQSFLSFFQNKYPYINVDESQDNSYIQHKIIELLARPQNNIFMVGDEDQSIYAFRAAFPKALLNFSKTYPGAKVLKMETNYRSPINITAPANQFIKQNKERYYKNMTSIRTEGTDIKFTQLKDRTMQYEYISAILKKESNLNKIALIFRNNLSAIPIIDQLAKDNIPFYIRETNIHFFNHWVTLDIKSFMEMALDQSNINAFKQIYFKLNCFLSKANFEFVRKNISKKQSVFDILLKIPDIEPIYKRKFRNFPLKFEMLAELEPAKAITYIVSKLGYKKYLNGFQYEDSPSALSLTNILDSLRILANGAKTFPEFFNKLDYIKDRLENSPNRFNRNSVTLSTIHACKGLEYNRVIILDLIDGQFPSTKSIEESIFDKRLLEEEIRLFYVGITRAKNFLELITYQSFNGKRQPISRFFTKLKKYQDNIIFQNNTSNYDNRHKLIHKKFGVGEILSIDNKKGISDVRFVNYGLKKISLPDCIDEGLIKIYTKE